MLHVRLAGCNPDPIKQARQRFMHSKVFKTLFTCSDDESTPASESARVVWDKYVRLFQSKEIRLYHPKVCSATVRRKVYYQKLTILSGISNIKNYETEKLNSSTY